MNGDGLFVVRLRKREELMLTLMGYIFIILTNYPTIKSFMSVCSPSLTNLMKSLLNQIVVLIMCSDGYYVGAEAGEA